MGTKRKVAGTDLAERPEKLLSRLGVASRREVARWIEAGRLAVDGRPLRGGERVDPDAALSLDGKPLKLPRARTPHRVILYNKPPGEIVSRSARDGRTSVFSALPAVAGGRWIAVGRLDVATSGLLLFTTDGTLAEYLMHPRHEVERRYVVRVHGEPSARELRRLTEEGVMLEDGPARFTSCLRLGSAGGSNRWFRVSLAEGRNREVRRIFAAIGVEVSRLRRIGYGPLELPRDLAPGAWRELGAAAVAELAAAVEPGRRRREIRQDDPGPRRRC